MKQKSVITRLSNSLNYTWLSFLKSIDLQKEENTDTDGADDVQTSQVL